MLLNRKWHVPPNLNSRTIFIAEKNNTRSLKSQIDTIFVIEKSSGVNLIRDHSRQLQHTNKCGVVATSATDFYRSSSIIMFDFNKKFLYFVYFKYLYEQELKNFICRNSSWVNNKQKEPKRQILKQTGSLTKKPID